MCIQMGELDILTMYLQLHIYMQDVRVHNPDGHIHMHTSTGTYIQGHKPILTTSFSAGDLANAS